MKSEVKVTADRLSGLSKAIRSLASARVMVGIPSEKAARKEDVGEEPIANAALGYIHENGAPEVNIPPRPFLVPGVREGRDNIVKYLRAAGLAALEGRPETADRNLNAAGLSAQNSVRKKIQTGPFVPLSKRTIAARKRRGRKGTKPLIDTGQLRNAITYVIRRGVKK